MKRGLRARVARLRQPRGPRLDPQGAQPVALTLGDRGGGTGAQRGPSEGREIDMGGQVGLAGVGRKPARRFSTGMKARLALAIALLADPPVLMLDEPQNGLDPEGIIELRELIRRLAAGGRTVLISSHQLGEIAQLTDDIGVLVGGRLAYQGTLRDFAPGGDVEAAYLEPTGAAR